MVSVYFIWKEYYLSTKSPSCKSRELYSSVREPHYGYTDLVGVHHYDPAGCNVFPRKLLLFASCALVEVVNINFLFTQKGECAIVKRKLRPGWKQLYYTANTIYANTIQL